MSFNRFLTSLIQLVLVVVCYYSAKQLYLDVKQNGFFPKDENDDHT